MNLHVLAKLLASLALSVAASGVVARDRTLLDDDWRFRLGDDAAWSASDCDDEDWRRVDLPHDWSIAGERVESAAAGGAGGFFPGGVGWYRRHVHIAETERPRQVVVEFEGIYHHARVWCNGREAATHASGYLPLAVDLSERVKPGDNVIAVRVDNSRQPNARWYTGSGITRHVWLETREVVHVVADSVQLETLAAAPKEARWNLRFEIANDAAQPARVQAKYELRDDAGHVIHEANLPPRSVAAGAKSEFVVAGATADPPLWSPRSPRLVTAIVRAFVDGRQSDDVQRTLGLRTVAVSPERGLLINGEPVELVGGNLHHDHGPLGAASFDVAEERRVRLLQAAGFNALRTAHNPPAPAFLDACDRLGMLVIDEAFDGWEAKKTPQDDGPLFAEQGLAQVEAMVVRDRRHPSVVMWSIGNEVYERGNRRGLELAGQLAERVRQADAHSGARPVTAGLNGLGSKRAWSELDPLFAVLDAAGYNYELARVDADHERVPQRIIFGSETYAGEAFADWRTTRRHSFVLGTFVWSAADYLGEAGIGRVFGPGETVRPHWEGSHFPWHGAACGDLDLLGRRRPHSHYRNIVWDRGEKLYAAVETPPPAGGPWQPSLWSPPPLEAHWTWPGREGETLTVQVFSRYDAARLELNGRALGEQPTNEANEFRAAFDVPYEAGTLVAIGLDGGTEVERCELATAGPAAEIRLTPEVSAIAADRQAVAFVNVELVDAAGQWTPIGDQEIAYEIGGPAEILAVGSADLASDEPYQAHRRRTFHGRAQIVLRSTGEPGEIRLTAKGDGVSNVSVVIAAGD